MGLPPAHPRRRPRPHRPGHRGATQRLVRAIAGVSATLGFALAARLTGPISDLPGDLVVDLLAVIREALTNVARHA